MYFNQLSFDVYSAFPLSLPLCMEGILYINFKIKITISLFDLTIALFDSALKDTIK